MKTGNLDFTGGSDGGLYHSGLMFTTYDQDNDQYSGNCALNYMGGWWMNACYYFCITCESNTGNYYATFNNAYNAFQFDRIKMTLKPSF